VTPVPCISEPGQFGDCWRACIASILDLCTSDVPHFMALAIEQGGGEFKTEDDVAYRLAREWLREQGLGIFRTWVSGRWSLSKLLEDFSAFNPGAPWILNGAALVIHQGEEGHAVVAMDGRIAHDPSHCGISGPLPCTACGDAECKGWWWIDVISVGENWQCGALAG
jgi:hypothetical protein